MDAERLARLASGDIDVRDEIATEFFHLAEKIGKKFSVRYRNDEFESVAYEELIVVLEKIRTGEKTIRSDSNIGAFLNSHLTNRLRDYAREEQKREKRVREYIVPHLQRQNEQARNINLNDALEDLYFEDILGFSDFTEKDKTILICRREGFTDPEIAEILDMDKRRVQSVKQLRLQKIARTILER